MAPINPRKKQILFRKYYVSKSQNIENTKNRVSFLENASINPEDPFHKFLKILNMGSISFKNMKWRFGNVQLN